MPRKSPSLLGKSEQKANSLEVSYHSTEPETIPGNHFKPQWGGTAGRKLPGIYSATYFNGQNQSRKNQEERVLEPSRVSKGIRFKILSFITLDKIVHFSQPLAGGLNLSPPLGCFTSLCLTIPMELGEVWCSLSLTQFPHL